MKQAEADLHDERLRDALATMNWLADNEEFFRDCFKYREWVATAIGAAKGSGAEPDATDAA